LHCLDGDLAAVEVDDGDVAVARGLVEAVVGGA
jgi:hypothetical protein